MLSHPLPPRWDYHSDGSLSQLSSFPNFSTPLPPPPPFPSSLDSQSLPLTSPLPVLSPLHNDSSFPLWSPVAPPPIPQIVGGAFSAFVDSDDEGDDDDDDGDDDGTSDDAGAPPPFALPPSPLASPTFSSTPIPRAQPRGLGPPGLGLGEHVILGG